MSRSIENWRRLAIAAVGLAHTGACTFNTFEVSECETSAECRSDFGLGYVCRDDGRCEEADPSRSATIPTRPTVRRSLRASRPERFANSSVGL